jgi:hypothetical protein
MTDNYELHKTRAVAQAEEFFAQQVKEGANQKDRTIMLAASAMINETETIEELRALVAHSWKPTFRSSLSGDNPEVTKRVAGFVQIIASSVELAYDQSPERRDQAAAFQAVAGLRQAGAQAGVTTLLSRIKPKPQP